MNNCLRSKFYLSILSFLFLFVFLPATPSIASSDPYTDDNNSKQPVYDENSRFISPDESIEFKTEEYDIADWDMYVNDRKESAETTIEVEEDGLYTIWIYGEYSGASQRGEEYRIQVNDSEIGPVIKDQYDGPEENHLVWVNHGTYYLKKGENTIKFFKGDQIPREDDPERLRSGSVHFEKIKIQKIANSTTPDIEPRHQGPVPDPPPDPTPEPEPEPAPAPTPNPDPNPDIEPRHQGPVPDPPPNITPNPLPDPTPEPTPQPEPEPDPKPNPIPDPAPDTTPDPGPEPTPNPDPIPDPDPIPEPGPNTPLTLGIDPANGHLLTYKGDPTALITYGEDREIANNENYYSRLREAGFNHKNINMMLGTDRSPGLYNYNDLRYGFNEETWALLKKNAEWAEANGIILSITLFSSALIEPGDGRWGANLWNEANGGPIGQGDCKDAFYTLDSYGQEINGGYNENWSWQKKNQWYQEQLVKKYLDTFAEFDNIIYLPMYEIGDHWGSSMDKISKWNKHISGLIKKKEPERLTGAILSTTNEQEIAAWNEVDLLFFEGPFLKSNDASKDLHDAYWKFDKPLAWLFLHPEGGTSRFPTTNDPDPVDFMYKAVLYGIMPASRSRSSGSQIEYTRLLAELLKNKAYLWGRFSESDIPRG
ncbi:MAG: hypothetical protein JW734_09630 [Candidatus Omnitrophica bacterium]|nr:hypothetical protein [Candidatus Omnitrophota bacterium]